MHYDGAGGYSGGGSENNWKNAVNGNGGGEDSTSLTAGSGGGGYYTAGHGERAKALGSSAVGGQCGGPCQAGPLDNIKWYKDVCGSGGASGSGGEIKYQKKENIFAFNGDMITNGDYTSTYYEYNKDGTQTTTKLKVYEREDLNGKKAKFIPAKIFAQSGTIRTTYTTNQGEYTLSKVKTGEKLPNIAKNVGEVVLVIATNEIPDNPTTGYTNPLTPELKNQGIGSRSSGI